MALFANPRAKGAILLTRDDTNMETPFRQIAFSTSTPEPAVKKGEVMFFWSHRLGGLASKTFSGEATLVSSGSGTAVSDGNINPGQPLKTDEEGILTVSEIISTVCRTGNLIVYPNIGGGYISIVSPNSLSGLLSQQLPEMDGTIVVSNSTAYADDAAAALAGVAVGQIYLHTGEYFKARLS